MDGEQRGEGMPPLSLSPLVSLPTRLWVIFSSFHGRAMNNLSLLPETQALLQPPPPTLIFPSADPPGPAAAWIPSLHLAVPALNTQSGLFVSGGVLQGPEINWGCGWMTSGPGFIKARLLEVCWLYNEVDIS